MVKVVDFALRGGKVAIHCHAGLGRTGVLIACYLVLLSEDERRRGHHSCEIQQVCGGGEMVRTQHPLSFAHTLPPFTHPTLPPFTHPTLPPFTHPTLSHLLSFFVIKKPAYLLAYQPSHTPHSHVLSFFVITKPAYPASVSAVTLMSPSTHTCTLPPLIHSESPATFPPPSSISTDGLPSPPPPSPPPPPPFTSSTSSHSFPFVHPLIPPPFSSRHPSPPSPFTHTHTSLSLHTCTDPDQSRHAPRLRLFNSLMYFSLHCGTSTLHRRATLPPSPPHLRGTSITSLSCYTGQRRET